MSSDDSNRWPTFGRKPAPAEVVVTTSTRRRVNSLAVPGITPLLLGAVSLLATLSIDVRPCSGVAKAAPMTLMGFLELESGAPSSPAIPFFTTPLSGPELGLEARPQNPPARATNEGGETDQRNRRGPSSRRSPGDRKQPAEAPKAATTGYSVYDILSAAQGNNAIEPTAPAQAPTSSSPTTNRTPRDGSILVMLVAATSPAATGPAATGPEATGPQATNPATTSPTAGPRLPKRLGLDAVARAARQVRGRVEACLKQFGFGVKTVRVLLTVSGATGRVETALAQGRFKTATAGRCIENAARSLEFKPFSRRRQVVHLPIRVE
ncbi:MAG: hypothetical protein ABI333_11010 [bacterium]